MVDVEESAEALAPLHVGVRAPGRGRSLEEPVVEALMVPLAVIVFDVLAREKAQVPFAERHDAMETLSSGPGPR